MNILITGGAGYIGSHMVDYLIESGISVTALDDLSNGHADAIHSNAKFIRGKVGDFSLINELLSKEKFDAVIHFAGSIQVGESVSKPADYYSNNVSQTLNLLHCMSLNKVNYLIFSSTAAIFGIPNSNSIDESHSKNPINPYGRSKWLIEQVLPDFERAYGLRSVCLRYFNASGAHPLGKIGERHNPETHLIPLALDAALGRRPPLQLFGNDYDTKDGTCIRDYVHVSDLCQAHLLAVKWLHAGNPSEFFNLGNSEGYSIHDVMHAIAEVTGLEVPHTIAARRDGDPPILIANSQKARHVLGWMPKYPDLKTIVEHTWQFTKLAGL